MRDSELNLQLYGKLSIKDARSTVDTSQPSSIKNSATFNG